MRFQLVFSIVLAGILVLLSQNAFCQFDESDFEGEWQAYAVAINATSVDVLENTLTIDANGDLTNSTAYNSTSLSIDSDGIVTGNLKNSTTTVDIPKAKMNQNKNVIDCAFTSNNTNAYGRYDFIKKSSNASTGDLEGIWEIVDYEVIENGLEPSYGFIEFYKNGSIKNSTGDLKDSTISIENATGAVNGSISGYNNETISIESGQISSSKQFMMMSYTSNSTFGINYLVKLEGSYSTNDLGATWHITQTQNERESETNATVKSRNATYGQFNLDNEGNLVGGNLISLLSDSNSTLIDRFVEFNTDQDAISDGEIEGRLIDNNADRNIVGGLSSSKQIGIYAYNMTDSPNVAGGGVMIRGEVVPATDDSDGSDSDGGGGGGGGGCAMNPDADFGFGWLLLLVVPALIFRMRKSE